MNDIIDKINNDDQLKIEKFGDNCIYFAAENLLCNISYLKNDEKYKFSVLVDIFSVDFPRRKDRFDIVYNFLSKEYNARVCIKVRIGAEKKVESLYGMFPNANWLEREVFDMMGIEFSNHPDHRRILTDYEFEGYPLRKDFPVEGRREVRYDFNEKKVVYEDTDLDQDMRKFNFSGPWQ